MRRWTIHILCAASLLIFLLAMGIWAWSYAGHRYVHYDWSSVGPTPGGRWVRTSVGIVWLNGIVMFNGNRSHYPNGTPYPSGWRYEDLRRRSRLSSLYVDANHGDPVNIRFAGVQFVRGPDYNGKVAQYWVVFPLWFFLLFAIPPSGWVVRRRRRGGRGFPVEVAEKAQATT